MKKLVFLLSAIIISGLQVSCMENKDVRTAFNDYINQHANNQKSVEIVEISQVDTFKTSTLKDALLDSCKVLDEQFKILDKIIGSSDTITKRGWKINSGMRECAFMMLGNGIYSTLSLARLTYKSSLHDFGKIPDVSMIRYIIKYREDENGTSIIKEICAYKDIKSDSVFIAKTPYGIKSTTVKRISKVKDTFMEEYSPLKSLMNEYEDIWYKFQSFCLMENGGTL